MSKSRATQLEALGRIPWHEAVGLLEGATCVWQDLDGLHRGPAPCQPPLATHLWAWDRVHAWRFRVDGDSCIGAKLTLPSGEAPQAWVIRARSTPDPQLAGLLGELAKDVRLIVVGDQSQALFLVANGED